MTRRKLFPTRTHKPKVEKPLKTKRDPLYQGEKHIKAIQNSDGWYR